MITFYPATRAIFRILVFVTTVLRSIDTCQRGTKADQSRFAKVLNWLDVKWERCSLFTFLSMIVSFLWMFPYTRSDRTMSSFIQPALSHLITPCSKWNITNQTKKDYWVDYQYFNLIIFLYIYVASEEMIDIIRHNLFCLWQTLTSRSHRKPRDWFCFSVIFPYFCDIILINFTVERKL